jgi:hypothetical protein
VEVGAHRKGFGDRTGAETLVEAGERVGCRLERRLKAIERQRM